MLRLAADENFNGDIVRGLLRRNPKLDIVRVQDVGLSGADDPSVLQWAADQGRIVVTHDISTLAKHAFDRIAAGQPMPGWRSAYQNIHQVQRRSDGRGVMTTAYQPV